VTRSIAGQNATATSVVVLAKAVERRRTRSIFEVEQAYDSEVQLMNFHQTKGRKPTRCSWSIGTTII
jgi:hypothetical protein